MGSETLPSVFYVLSNESRTPTKAENLYLYRKRIGISDCADCVALYKAQVRDANKPKIWLPQFPS